MPITFGPLGPSGAPAGTARRMALGLDRRRGPAAVRVRTSAGGGLNPLEAKAYARRKLEEDLARSATERREIQRRGDLEEEALRAKILGEERAGDLERDKFRSDRSARSYELMLKALGVNQRASEMGLGALNQERDDAARADQMGMQNEQFYEEIGLNRDRLDVDRERVDIERDRADTAQQRVEGQEYDRRIEYWLDQLRQAQEQGLVEEAQRIESIVRGLASQRYGGADGGSPAGDGGGSLESAQQDRAFNDAASSIPAEGIVGAAKAGVQQLYHLARQVLTTRKIEPSKEHVLALVQAWFSRDDVKEGLSSERIVGTPGYGGAPGARVPDQSSGNLDPSEMLRRQIVGIGAMMGN